MRRFPKEGSQGKTLVVFKDCLGKLRIKFIKKYDTRKQKAHMYAGIVKPRGLLVDSMSSRSKIMNNYHISFPFPDNT